MFERWINDSIRVLWSNIHGMLSSPLSSIGRTRTPDTLLHDLSHLHLLVAIHNHDFLIPNYEFLYPHKSDYAIRIAKDRFLQAQSDSCLNIHEKNVKSKWVGRLWLSAGTLRLWWRRAHSAPDVNFSLSFHLNEGVVADSAGNLPSFHLACTASWASVHSIYGTVKTAHFQRWCEYPNQDIFFIWNGAKFAVLYVR